MIWRDHCEAPLAGCPEGIQPLAILSTRIACCKKLHAKETCAMLPVQCVHAEDVKLTCDRSYRTAGVDELKACNIYQMNMSNFYRATIAGAASEFSRRAGLVSDQQQKSTVASLTKLIFSYLSKYNNVPACFFIALFGGEGPEGLSGIGAGVSVWPLKDSRTL